MSGSCSHCQKPSTRMSTCSCFRVSYCDSICQKADWKRHKSSCPPYRIQPVLGKGMVATRKIKAGAVILEEYPLLSVDRDDALQNLQLSQSLPEELKQKVLSLHDPGQNSFDALQILQLSQSLPEELKQKVLSLHDPGQNSYQHQNIMSVLQLIDSAKEGITEDMVKFTRIVMGNYNSVGETDNEFGVNASALYENISRINHSCAPNSFWFGKKDNIYIKVVRALTNIEKGEEILASYLEDSFMLKSERKEKLRIWHIDCTCKVCSLEQDELKKNEDLRSKIIEQHENVPKFGLQDNIADALSAAKEKINLMSKKEDEFIRDMPKALLELYELSFTFGNQAYITGLQKNILQELTSEYKKRAFEVAKKFGSAHVYRYENKINSLSLVQMLNDNAKGGELWPVVDGLDRSLYVVTGEVARGVLVRLMQAGMKEEATKLYTRTELTASGTYSKQDTQAKVLKLILKSYYSLEELQIIITEFFNDLKKTSYIGDKNVLISVFEAEIPPSGVFLLKKVVPSKKEALNRVSQILASMDPPMTISTGSLPFITKEEILNYVTESMSPKTPPGPRKRGHVRRR